MREKCNPKMCWGIDYMIQWFQKYSQVVSLPVFHWKKGNSDFLLKFDIYKHNFSHHTCLLRVTSRSLFFHESLCYKLLAINKQNGRICKQNALPRSSQFIWTSNQNGPNRKCSQHLRPQSVMQLSMHYFQCMFINRVTDGSRIFRKCLGFRNFSEKSCKMCTTIL